jgi:nicotinate-nucleotide adenylyltransferase
MHIGLYFGSFNPIHTGHLIIANHILEHTEVDKIWFVVSPQNPLKPAHTLLNEFDRLHLVQLAIEGNNNMRASNIEFSLPKPSYTIDTMAYLHDKFPLEKFSIIMGSDSFQNLERWKNAEILIANYEIIIYKRPGYEIDNKVGAKINVVNAPLIEISSSLVRSLVKENKSIRYLMPDTVMHYILENRYYK